MEKQRRVALYGSSLFIAGLEASLKDKPGLDVVRIEAPLLYVAERVKALRPDVVIFDINTVNPDHALPLLREHPGLALIGLDVNSNKVIVFSSQPYQTLTADDLVQVIQMSGGARM